MQSEEGFAPGGDEFFELCERGRVIGFDRVSVFCCEVSEISGSGVTF